MDAHAVDPCPAARPEIGDPRNPADEVDVRVQRRDPGILDEEVALDATEHHIVRDVDGRPGLRSVPNEQGWHLEISPAAASIPGRSPPQVDGGSFGFGRCPRRHVGC